VIDFQAVLTSQAVLAEALAKAGMGFGQRHPHTRALRDGYHLVARILWSRRASIPEVHDLAWLDHTVVSEGARLGKPYAGPEDAGRWERLGPSAGDTTLRGLAPPQEEWTEVLVEAFGGTGPLKLARGRSGSFEVGVLTQPELIGLSENVARVRPRAEELGPVLDDIEAFAAAARRAGRPGVALVFAASSFEGDAAE